METFEEHYASMKEAIAQHLPGADMALIDKAETQEERNLITRLIGHWAAVTPYDESAMDGAIRKVNISLKRAQADRYREQLASYMNKESTKVLLEEYRECLNDLRRYIDEEN